MDCSVNIDNDQFDLSSKDILQALKAKEDGNICYKDGKYDSSIEFYSKAISLCPLDDNVNMTVFLGNRYSIIDSNAILLIFKELQDILQ